MAILEYRGIKNAVVAELIKDDEDGIEYGPVKRLVALSELTKTTESSSETHYYDDMPAVVISSTGADEVTCNGAALSLDMYAWISGYDYDETTGAVIEGSRVTRYLAFGYETGRTGDGSDENSVYVWRLKGTFGIPDSTHATIDDGTDANGQELVYTGIQTTHKFAKTGKGARAVVVDVGLGLADVTGFFDEVTTPDTLKAKA